MASHYGYRDFHAGLTTTIPVTAAQLVDATYSFGTNARALNNRNWPNISDFDGARTVFARSVMVQCTQNAWIALVSICPRWVTDYITLIARDISSTDAVGRLSDLGISQFITEVPQYIPANSMITFHPTLGVSVIFYQVTLPGIIRFWIEGNAEGAE